MKNEEIKRSPKINETVKSLMEKVSDLNKKISALQKKNMTLEKQCLSFQRRNVKLEQKMLMLQKKIVSTGPPDNLAERLCAARERVRNHKNLQNNEK